MTLNADRRDNCWALTLCALDPNCPAYEACKRKQTGVSVNPDDVQEEWQKRAAILDRAIEIVDETFDGFIIPPNERMGYIVRIAAWLASE